MNLLIRLAWQFLKIITTGPTGKRKGIKYSLAHADNPENAIKRKSFYITLLPFQPQDRSRHED